MAETASGEFERAIERIEQVVRELENGAIGLDRSVELYKEGTVLARRCEELLKAAQAAVDAAAQGDPTPASGPARQLPL